MNVNKKAIFVCATLLLMAALAGLGFAQTAVIKIKGYSPDELTALKWKSPRSTGLATVGVNQLVYLVGRDSANASVTAYAWTLTTKPAASNAVLDSTTKWQTTFKPDVVGQYTVQLVITTTKASKPVAVTINAGKFVGVGGMDGLPIDPSAGQCALCHSANFTQWSKTGHSDMLKRGLNGTLSSHYSEACIECHTTGYDLDASGNDGFDDVQKEVGWKFPTTLKAGMYDTLLLKYPKLAHRANIQCESCHGPGSEHKGNKANIAMSLDASVCGYCHEEGPYHVKNLQWKESAHAVGIEAEAVRTDCAKCHSGWAFIRRVDPIPNDKRPALGFGQISCAVCHDQHRADLPSQVRSLDNVTLGDSVTVVNYGGNGKICMQCHISRRDAADYSSTPTNLTTRFSPHGSNQADMIDGSNAIDFGIPIGSSGHKFAVTNTCVTCHMGATPAAGKPGNNKIGEHTFAMAWDGGTPTNLADDVENVGVCQPCHGPITSFGSIMAKADYDEDGNIEPTIVEVDGLVKKLDSILPPRTSNTVIKQNYDWTLAGLSPADVIKRKNLAKAWYNLTFVTNDKSGGVHNAGYAIALLRRSIEVVTRGSVGTAKISSINDVPNDQGKQVRVSWSKFPGDGIAIDPVTGYSVWRRVDKAAGAAANQVDSKEAMFAQAAKENVGKRYEISQAAATWDFVAWVPAAGHEFYSTVAPTVYDSTAKGKNWSVFFVAGHITGRTLETAPDSGYSVDNLPPFAPSNFTVKGLAGTNLELNWAASEDLDFEYFALYRSTTENFDPKGAKPLATLPGTKYTDSDVKVGTNYYYWLSAFDQGGNESKFTRASFTVGVTEHGGGVPTEFALEQNYPNPFNPETMIKYQLSGASHVRLRVFTALGQEVRTLVDGMQPAQYYSVMWDGRDNAGRVMPSGLYIYRLETEKFTAIKKMIMMK